MASVLAAVSTSFSRIVRTRQPPSHAGDFPMINSRGVMQIVCSGSFAEGSRSLGRSYDTCKLDTLNHSSRSFL